MDSCMSVKHFVVVVFGSQCITNNTNVDIFWLDETFLAAWDKVIAWHMRVQKATACYSQCYLRVSPKTQWNRAFKACELQQWIRRRERDVERAKSFHNGRRPSDWKTKLWANCPQHVGKVKKKTIYQDLFTAHGYVEREPLWSETTSYCSGPWMLFWVLLCSLCS